VSKLLDPEFEWDLLERRPFGDGLIAPFGIDHGFSLKDFDEIGVGEKCFGEFFDLIFGGASLQSKAIHHAMSAEGKGCEADLRELFVCVKTDFADLP